MSKLEKDSSLIHPVAHAPTPTKDLDHIESIDVPERDWYGFDPIFASRLSALFSFRSWFRTRAARKCFQDPFP